MPEHVSLRNVARTYGTTYAELPPQPLNEKVEPSLQNFQAVEKESSSDKMHTGLDTGD